MNVEKYKMTAHRGLFNNNGGIPENSMAAFSLAVAEGYAIELDVHLTADGELAVFHDHSLKRMTGDEREIEKCTLGELGGLRLLGTEWTVPTLEEVLELVDGKVALLIEIKNRGLAGPLERRLISELDGYRGEYMIESFNPLPLIWIRRHRPRIPLGQLLDRKNSKTGGFLRKVVCGHMLLNPLFRPDFVACHLRDAAVQRESCRRSGRRVFCWTARGEKQIEKFRDLCDGLIFEMDGAR